MRKLIPVEDATELMNKAKDWSVWHWLLEKKRVRTAADKAVDALRDAEKEVKHTWSEDLKKAYHEIETQQAFEKDRRARPRFEKAQEEAKHIDPQIKESVKKVKDADDEAETARLDAEDTFAQAEIKMSSGLARQGAEKAVYSWELRMKAIRKAETLAKK